MTRRAFSLIEMLLATALVAILMGGVLLMLGGVNRDARTLGAMSSRDDLIGLFDLIGRDLRNAQSVVTSAEDRTIQLSGNIGIDPSSLAFNGRFARVVYRVDAEGQLRREQTYLDAPDRPQPWADLAASGITAISLSRDSSDSPRARVIVETSTGNVSRDLQLR